MSRPVALITGVTGQDGRYASEQLIAAGYRVVGTTRSLARPAADPLRAAGAVELVEWDLLGQPELERLLAEVRPTEFYNFAAYSTGSGMFDDAVGIGDINGLAVVRILEAIRAVDPAIRFCQASSSKMFGEPATAPQNEDTIPNPSSPYGAAKLYAHAMIGVYRRRFGLFACSAILFNHESPLRGENFVTRKITHAMARIKLGLQDRLRLGNLDALRDWGHARDYVEMQRLMLQQDAPDDYVIATGVQHSVRDFCTAAARELGIALSWQGRGLDEKGVDQQGRCIVSVDPRHFQPAEVDSLLGDPTKAREKLGWSPKVGFDALVAEMVREDLKAAERDALSSATASTPMRFTAGSH